MMGVEKFNPHRNGTKEPQRKPCQAAEGQRGRGFEVQTQPDQIKSDLLQLNSDH